MTFFLFRNTFNKKLLQSLLKLVQIYISRDTRSLFNVDQGLLRPMYPVIDGGPKVKGVKGKRRRSTVSVTEGDKSGKLQRCTHFGGLLTLPTTNSSSSPPPKTSSTSSIDETKTTRVVCVWDRITEWMVQSHQQVGVVRIKVVL